jgi:ApaG protein
VSSATTKGIRVEVESRFLEGESSPQNDHYVFAYTVTIANDGGDTVQLKTRHWVITDGTGHVEEVRGPGVVGAQPVLKPGQAFRYTSGCVLRTPRGTMHGTYQMHMDDGSMFDAEIAPFLLVAPGKEQKRYLN